MEEFEKLEQMKAKHRTVMRLLIEWVFVACGASLLCSLGLVMITHMLASASVRMQGIDWSAMYAFAIFAIMIACAIRIATRPKVAH